jgi:hypothetical protein
VGLKRRPTSKLDITPAEPKREVDTVADSFFSATLSTEDLIGFRGEGEKGLKEV